MLKVSILVAGALLLPTAAFAQATSRAPVSGQTSARPATTSTPSHNFIRGMSPIQPPLRPVSPSAPSSATSTAKLPTTSPSPQ